jgi:hypothetical protein
VTNLNIGITEPAIGRPAILRADPIQWATLIAVGRALAEGDDNSRLLINALEDLGTISHDPAPGELDRALADVATLARLDTARMDLTASDVRQLFEQAARARTAPAAVVELPRQQDRRWSA